MMPRFEAARGHQHARPAQSPSQSRRRPSAPPSASRRGRRTWSWTPSRRGSRRRRPSRSATGRTAARHRRSRSRSAGAIGTTAQAAKAGISAIAGASANSSLLARAGITISLISSLMTSANGWPMPGSRPKMRTRFGPQTHLHPADELALPQRQVGDREDQYDHQHNREHRRSARRAAAAPTVGRARSRVALHSAAARRGRRACAAASRRGARSDRSDTSARSSIRHRPPTPAQRADAASGIAGASSTADDDALTRAASSSRTCSED